MENNLNKPLIVDCPHCQKKVVWDKNNAYRPFCSERCKLIDLGEWASDKHAIPGDEDINAEIEAEKEATRDD